MFSRAAVFCHCLALVLLFSPVLSSSISLERAIFKVNFVKDGEKVQRVKFTVSDENINDVSDPSGFEIDTTDSLSVQASFVDEDGDPAFVQQLFLRFTNLRTGLDNLYIVKKKLREMRFELKFYNEVRSDLDFWTVNDTYMVQLIMGDPALTNSASWTITKAMKFTGESKGSFAKKARTVFDFDVSIKKTLLPEFVSQIPEAEKRAHPAAVLAALLFVLIPLPLLIFAWTKLGVFPLTLSSDKSSRASTAIFQLCLVGHLGVLVMFWVQWNIVTTWKAIIVLMVPTFLSGQKVLSADASLTKQ